MLVRDAITLAEQRLPRRPGLPDSRREGQWLLAHAWGVSETRVRTEPDTEVPELVAERYLAWLQRRAAGEPAHHLTGTCPFWGRELQVSPAVLIPRPETELLIEAALALPLPAAARVLDVGTGSGCIALTLAAERPSWQVFASDRSLAALAVARANLNAFAVGVHLLSCDLAAAMRSRFDLVTANLPYVPTAQIPGLEIEVRHDPWSALDGGSDGLDLVDRLLDDLPDLLADGGRALLELGEDQADQVAGRAAAAGLATEQRIRDLGGCERIIVLHAA
jgi:release factor glutamine methyltransferase